MASYTFFLVTILAVCSQGIFAKQCENIEICFHDAVRALDANLNKVVIDMVDTIEPKYQAIRITAKNELEHAIEELDAIERNADAEVEGYKSQAQGDISHCLKTEIQIGLLTEDTRKASQRCVDATLDSLDSYFDIGVIELYNLRKQVDLLVLEFSMCVDLTCQESVYAKVGSEEDRLLGEANKIATETGEKMENALTGIEVMCFSAHRQALRIKLREIVNDIAQCIANV